MPNFLTRRYAVKPLPGTPLVRGGIAPDRVALPLNETGGTKLIDYAGWAAINPARGSTNTQTQGKNGPRIATGASASSAIQPVVGADSVIMPTGPVTIMLGYRKTDTTNRGSSSFGNGVGGGSILNCHMPFSDGTVYFDYGGQSGGTTRLSIGGLTFKDDVWAFTVGARGMEIWQNGRLVASNAANPTRTLSGNLGLFAGNSSSDAAEMDFFYVWGSQISVAVIQELAVTPFKVFQEPQAVRTWPGFLSLVPLTVTASDTLSLSDALTLFGAGFLTFSDALSLSDALNQGTVIENAFTDTLNLSDDSPNLVLAGLLAFADTLAIADFLGQLIALKINLSETLSFSDAIEKTLALFIQKSDTISLSDFLVVYFIVGKHFNDNLLLSDVLLALLAQIPSYSEQLTFSDSTTIRLSLELKLSDALSLLDAAVTQSSLNLRLALSDTLTLSDSLTLSLGGALDSYIRHYLNDVPR